MIEKITKIAARWKGTKELWMDEVQNEAYTSPCTLEVHDNELHYHWKYKEKECKGVLKPLPNGDAEWHDSFHQPQTAQCKAMMGSAAMLKVSYSYPAPEGPPWGWNIILSIRPDNILVLQMTNIPPWGEECRAVRMIMQQV